MCAQFGVHISGAELKDEYDVQVQDTLDVIDERFYPHKPAPCIILDPKDKLKLVAMNFSLVPSWSKVAKPKFATHNARIETILEKPTWRSALKKNHCIIPISKFYEASYEGPHAGHLLEFTESKDKLLFAAGIFDKWINPEDEKALYSFTIITTEPNKFILDNGHDRCPAFLDFKLAQKWLHKIDVDSKEQIDFLKKSIQIPSLKIKEDRKLKSK